MAIPNPQTTNPPSSASTTGANPTGGNTGSSAPPPTSTNPFQGFIDSLFGGIDPTSWLGSLGGSIASGFEAGFVSLLHDIWDVIIGPLEMIAGVALAILILLWAFRDDLMTIGAMFIK